MDTFEKEVHCEKLREHCIYVGKRLEDLEEQEHTNYRGGTSMILQNMASWIRPENDNNNRHTKVKNENFLGSHP